MQGGGIRKNGLEKLLPLFVGLIMIAIGFFNVLSFPSHARAATKTWTSQADWQAGTTSNIDATATPGSIKLSSSVGGASIAFRAASDSGGQGQTANKPTGVVDNDVMIGVVTVFAGVGDVTTLTITPPSGWNLIRRVNHAGENMGMATYYKVAASEGASYTWTLSGGTSLVGIMAYSGVDTADPIDVENAATDLNGNPPGFGLSHTTPSVTTTVANTRIVTAFAHGDGRGVFSPPAGETERFETAYGITGSDIASAGNDEAQVAIGATGAKTASMSGIASGGISQILALAPGTATTYNTPGTDTVQFDSGTSATTWSALSWTGSTPTNTAIKARARAAESQGGLASATWSSYVTISGGAINLTGRYSEVEWHLSTTDTSVTPTLDDANITYTLASGGGDTDGGGSDTGGTPTATPSATPTPTIITVNSCSASIKNLTLTTNHTQAELSFTTTTNTKGILYYYGNSKTNPAGKANTKAKNYDIGSIKIEEDTATKDHKITIRNLAPSTNYFYTLTLSNGTVECEHSFTTQAPPPTPTPTPQPSPTATNTPKPVISNISGYIYEQGTTTPIPHVTVYMYKRWLFGWRITARVNTNADGFWQFTYEKGKDYRIGNSLSTKPIGAPDTVPRAGFDFAQAGTTCPASESNYRFLGWYGEKQLTEISCENNIFYASKAAQNSGTVIDATTQQPAPGLTVALRRKEFFGLFWRTTAFATTDAQGRWQFAYLTGYEYQAYLSVQDSKAIFPQGTKLSDGTQVLATYKANGRPATPGCDTTSQDDRTINWNASARLTGNGCSNSTFYVTRAVTTKVQVLVDKANAPLPNVQLRILGKKDGIWRGSQDFKKTDAQGMVTYAYFPGTTFRIYTSAVVPGYVQGYTKAYPGCAASTVTTTSRLNLVEWANDKPLPPSGCSAPTRFYMTSIENVNLAVTIDPPGGEFRDKVKVKLSYTPENHVGTIRYRYGSSAKTTSPKFKPGSEIVVTKTSRLFAKVYGSESPDAVADFTITKATPAPSPTPTPTGSPEPEALPSSTLTVTANPKGGDFDEPATVSLTASDPTAKIFYTADGTDPTTNGTPYSAPITLSASTLLHFYAEKDTTESGLGEEEYTFKNSEDPIIIEWEPTEEDDPPPYVVKCNDEVLTTTTATTYTDTALHDDGCVYTITSDDSEIPPTKISFDTLTESTQAAAVQIGKIAAALAALVAIIPLVQLLARLPDMLRYAWIHLFLLLRIRKKGHIWARVESAVTTKGIFGVSIAFSDPSRYNRVIDRTYSDLKGNFAVTDKPGTYLITASHPDYIFPSRISAKGYHGDAVRITEQGAPEITIPMDESNGGPLWQQWLKATAFRLASLNVGVAVIGLALTTYCLVWGVPDLTTPVLWINGILGAYYVLLFIHEMRHWRSGRKTVVVHHNGKPTPRAIIRLKNDLGETVATQATDQAGRALLMAPRGAYTLTAMVPTEKGARAAEKAIQINRTPLGQKVIINIE